MVNRHTCADKVSRDCIPASTSYIFYVIPCALEGEHNKTAEPDSVHRRIHWNNLQEGPTMQHSTQFGVLSDQGTRPRCEECTYRAVTVAAIVMVLASIWVF